MNDRKEKYSDGTVVSQTPQKSDMLRLKVYFDLKAAPCPQ